MKRNKQKSNTSQASWKALFRFYKQVKIPWVWVIIMLIVSLASKKAQNLLVPYTSKIMTGAITEHGFIFWFVLMTLVNVFFQETYGSLGELCRIKTTKNVQHKIWSKLIRLPMSYYDKHEPQKFVSRVTQDTSGAYAAISSCVQLLAIFYGIYTNFLSMYMTYHELALIMLSGIPIAIISTIIVGKLQYKYEYITNNSISAITNFFAERLPNLFHIKTCNTETAEYEKGIVKNEERFRSEMKAKRYFIFTGPIGSIAQYINEIVLLLVASAMVRAGAMQMYHLVNLYNYYLLFMGNAFMITAAWQGLKTSHGACATIASIANETEECLDEGKQTNEIAEDIRFDRVSFGYTEDKTVLKDVSFTVPKGKVTAIVGENGCGKSTIIKLLERFSDPISGSIYLGDEALRDMNLSQWRDSVGYLFQGDQIVKGSIRENLTYGLEREYSEDELIEAVKLANAYEFIMEKEDGFETEISRFDAKLSGGEMQRLAIARIILKKPKYLIMDEATSGIDAVNEAEVLDALTNMMKDKTVIMVSHDMKLIRSADNIVVLDEGVVEASGSFEQVKNSSELFARFLETQTA